MTDQPLTCSAVARALAEQPIGTAGCQAGFLLLEWPLPWPRDVADVEVLAPVVVAARLHGIRVQLVAAALLGPRSTVTLHRRPPVQDDSFRAYVRSSMLVARTDVVDAALDLVTGSAPVARLGDDEVVDVLVCTHGKRDRCCGSSGTSLYQELSRRAEVGATSRRLWRTSHLGGHRFAPTTLVLPAGTMWASMDADLVDQSVAADDHSPELLDHYRGCAGLASAESQVLERAVVERVGWSVTSRSRRTWRDDGGRLSMSVTDLAGRTQRWAADVSVSGELPAPTCGSPLDSGTEAVPQWTVDGLREVSPDDVCERGSSELPAGS